MALTRNEALAARIAETGWSQPQLAAAMVHVAKEVGATALYAVTRSHVSQWVRGHQPGETARSILCETLSRKLGRRITPADIGLADEPSSGTAAGLDWNADTPTVLAALGSDDLDMERRQILTAAAYTAAGLAVPGAAYWALAPDRARARPPLSTREVSQFEVEDLRKLTVFYAQRDQKSGGAAGRSALAAHLKYDAAPLLNSQFTDDTVRRATYSAVGEMTYLAGWTAFDAGHQHLAQRYLVTGVQLAAEAGDGPLAAYILRALAHQAVDLRLPGQALEYATASMSPLHYGQATHRERSLLAIVHARALAASGDRAGTLAAISRAERDLGRAGTDDAPDRVAFFGEASLAHETACALRDLGSPRDAAAHFKRSVATRQQQVYTRTHSVTLGYLGSVQVQQGHLDEACATWDRALDAMTGVRSGRARDVIVRMRRDLSPFKRRGSRKAAELELRAADMLRAIG